MIQRIQSLYLVLAVSCQIVLCCVPLVGVKEGTKSFNDSIAALGISGQSGLWALSLIFVLTLLAIVCNVWALFGYKNRLRQIKLGLCSKLSQFAVFVLSFIEDWYLSDSFSLIWIMGLSMVILLLLTLATRAIRKDEALVRAADRIR